MGIPVGAGETMSDRFQEGMPVGAAVVIPAEFGVVWTVGAEEGILEEAEQALAVRFGLHRVGFEEMYRVALGADDRVGEGCLEVMRGWQSSPHRVVCSC